MPDAVVEDERAQFVRDLHDAITHSVSQIHVHAAALRTLGAACGPASVEAIRIACAAAMHDLRRMHAVIRDGSPAPLEPQPTLATLQGLIDALRAGGTIVEFELGGCSVPPSTAAGAHRIVLDVVEQLGGPARGGLRRLDVRESAGHLDLILVLRPGHRRPALGPSLVRAEARARLLGGSLTLSHARGTVGVPADGSQQPSMLISLPLEVLS